MNHDGDGRAESEGEKEKFHLLATSAIFHRYRFKRGGRDRCLRGPNCNKVTDEGSADDRPFHSESGRMVN
jgi:hypothetical protein